MKIYKLIKEYPQSPLKNTIVFKNVNGQYTTENLFLTFDRVDIELYPEFWQEVKEPVFISDDGVEMFKGDDVYFVVNFELSTMVYVVNDWFKTATPDYKRFSTKEAALKYIDLNKPKYSKSDVIESLITAEYYAGFRKPSCEELIKHLFGE